MCLSNSDLHNFADDTTITITKNISISDLLCTLDKEAKSADN